MVVNLPLLLMRLCNFDLIIWPFNYALVWLIFYIIGARGIHFIQHYYECHPIISHYNCWLGGSSWTGVDYQCWTHSTSRWWLNYYLPIPSSNSRTILNTDNIVSSYYHLCFTRGGGWGQEMSEIERGKFACFTCVFIFISPSCQCSFPIILTSSARRQCADI